MSTIVEPAAPRAEHTAARVVGVLARWAEVYSRAAVSIARVGTAIGVTVVILALAGNVFTRNVLGYSLFGSEELARFTYLWVIWLGVSLAVKRGAVTVISFVADAGPDWWRRAVRTFSGVSLAVLLLYACVRSTEYATGQFASQGSSPSLHMSWFYPVVSMTVGYYFITLHYLAAALEGATRLLDQGRAGLRTAALAAAGAFAIGFVVWAVTAGLLAAGAAELVALGVIFVALTLAGTPIVFMLSIVGIIAFLPSFLGLQFYPANDPLVPFRTTQGAMGFGGSELIVILMFLVVAEVMNASGMSLRLIAFAASIVGHLRGGMAYVCQVTSAVVSGISGSAQADAAIMTPLLVPAMEREGYRRDVAAAVVAGASIKGPIGPLSIMFIVYGSLIPTVSIEKLLLSGLMAEMLLLIFQAATVYIVVRRMDFLQKRPFAGWGTVARTGLSALPVLLIPFIILGGFFSGVFTLTEGSAVAAVAAIGMALFWFAGMSPTGVPRVLVLAGLETGIVMLLLGDSAILAHALFLDRFGQTVSDFFTGITDNKYVFLLIVNLILLAVGIFLEPLPALYILAPFMAPIATLPEPVGYGIDPTHFGLIMVFNLVLALIHPPIGLVLFLVSSLAKVSIERLSIMILPWLAVSLLVLFLVTYLPSEVVLVLTNLLE